MIEVEKQCAAKIEAYLYAKVMEHAIHDGLLSAPRPAVRLNYKDRHRYRFFAHTAPVAASVCRTLKILGIAVDRCYCRANTRGRSSGVWVILGRLSKIITDLIGSPEREDAT